MKLIGGAASRSGAARRRRGGVIVIAGPDGAGKSSLSRALPAAAFAGAPFAHFHHRFGILPQRDNSDVDITRPQEQRPYPVWLCWVKSIYLFVDYQLGWQLHVRPLVRRGGWVILERGWWDIAIDQRRYRMRSSGRLLRALGRLLPRPDLVIILAAPAEMLLARKAEVLSAELERQLEAWRTVLPAGVPRAFIDSSQSPVEMVGAAADSVRRVSCAV